MCDVRNFLFPNSIMKKPILNELNDMFLLIKKKKEKLRWRN